MASSHYYPPTPTYFTPTQVDLITGCMRQAQEEDLFYPAFANMGVIIRNAGVNLSDKDWINLQTGLGRANKIRIPA